MNNLKEVYLLLSQILNLSCDKAPDKTWHSNTNKEVTFMFTILTNKYIYWNYKFANPANINANTKLYFTLLYHYYFLPLLLVSHIRSIIICVLYIWTNHISHHIHTSDNNPIRFINSLRIWIKVHINCFFRFLLPVISLKTDINWLGIIQMEVV